MTYHVKLIYPKTPASDEAIEQMAAAIESVAPGMYGLFDTESGHTEITVQVEADSLSHALDAGLTAASKATDLLGVRPDSMEILSEREACHRLGGAEARARMWKFLQELDAELAADDKAL